MSVNGQVASEEASRAPRKDAEEAAKEAEEAGEKRPAKSSRKSYTEYQKELVVMADAEGGRKKRLEVAHLIGMPSKTADHVIALFKAHGREALHDARHDRRTHLGKGAKKDSELLQLLLEWLHMDAKLTHRQLRDLVNLEVFRRIVKAEGLELGDEEMAPNSPITVEHIEKYFAQKAVQDKYKAQHVENENTISHWLDGLVVSRKYILDDTEVVNGPEQCEARLKYAKDLLEALEDEKAYLVFMDECPLWLSMTHPPGRSEDVKLQEHVHAYLAVSPSTGFVKSEVFVTEGQVHDQKHGLEHNPVQFKRFLNALLLQITANLGKVKGKDVYIIADCPSEYISSVTEHKSLHSVPAWEALSEELAKAGNKAYLVKMATNSPPLNLGEYLDRRLRNACNETLHDLVVNESDNAEFLKHPTPGHHYHLLEKVVRKGLEALAEEAVDSAAVVRLTDAIKDTIAEEGVLDFKKTYAHLFGDA